MTGLPDRLDPAGAPSPPKSSERSVADGRHPVLVPDNWGDHLSTSEWRLGDDGLPFRTAARVLVLTRDGDVLLLKGHDAADPTHSWVFTPGGGLRPGEDPRAGAVRELAEESGIDVVPADLEGPIAHREAIFRFATVACRQDEVFFLLRIPARRPVGREGWTDLERDVVDSVSWWSLKDLETAQERGQEIYPVRLPALVRELTVGWNGEPVDATDPADAEILAELDRTPLRTPFTDGVTHGADDAADDANHQSSPTDRQGSR